MATARAPCKDTIGSRPPPSVQMDCPTIESGPKDTAMKALEPSAPSLGPTLGDPDSTIGNAVDCA